MDVLQEIESRADGSADSFWGRHAAHEAAGQVVGLVLLSPPVADGPLAWSEQHRFWIKSNSYNCGRLALFEVKAAFAVGNFMEDRLLPASGSSQLLPVAAHATRMPMFAVTGLASGKFAALPFVAGSTCGIVFCRFVAELGPGIPLKGPGRKKGAGRTQN